MEYPQQAWLAFFASILSAYILGVWCHSVWFMSDGPDDGEGTETTEGADSYVGSKKPYNSGDARSGL